VIKSRIIRWAGHAERIRGEESANRHLVGKNEAKTQLGRHTVGEYNI
jgi:hypothetical protein